MVLNFHRFDFTLTPAAQEWDTIAEAAAPSATDVPGDDDATDSVGTVGAAGSPTTVPGDELAISPAGGSAASEASTSEPEAAATQEAGSAAEDEPSDAAAGAVDDAGDEASDSAGWRDRLAGWVWCSSAAGRVARAGERRAAPSRRHHLRSSRIRPAPTMRPTMNASPSISA